MRAALATLLGATTLVVADAAQPVRAATLDVCVSGCAHATIQAALDVAAPGDEIVVAAGTYRERIVVPPTSPLTIVGSGPTTILDAEAAGTALTVPAGVELTVDDLVIRNGRTSGRGGGIANDGSVTLRNVELNDNVAGDNGGGIYNLGTIVVEDSVIQRNLAGDEAVGDRGLGGAGIASFGPTAAVTVRRSTIAENRAYEPTTDFRGGGAINSNFGDVTIEDSVIVDNDGGFSAGAIDVRGSGGLLTMVRTTVTGNRARSGGGIVVRSSGRADIQSSLIAGNSAESSGGGLVVDSIATVTNSTISGNVAGSSGGGVRAGSGLTLDSVTITDNEAPFGGGVWTNRTVTAVNTVIAGNRGDADWPDCLGAVTTTGPLFVGEPATCTATASPLVTGDARLSPLADHGGATLTHLPAPESALIDNGLTSLATDQRDLPRPSGSAADLGAVEVQSVVDVERPTFPGGSLSPSNLQSTSVDLTWTAASDDVGVVGYEILSGKVVLASAGPSDLTATVGNLTPETTYTLTLVAIDAAGNRSIDGPAAIVTTPPVPPSGHLGPATATADTGWADVLPFGLVDLAGSSGDLIVVASSGSLPQVIAQITPTVATPIDIDGDGADDIDVTATPNVLSIGPSFDIVVDRLTFPGPSDVEVMAFIDLGTIAGSVFPNVLVNGFRTLAPDLGAGGTLPQQLTLAMGVDVPTGLDHRLEQRYATTAPTGPLLFATGVVEGNDRVTADAAQILTMTVDDVPSTIDTTFTLEASDVTDPTNAGFDVGFTWRSPDTEPRPTVVFALGERERRVPVIAEHQVTATFDAIAPIQAIRFRMTDDPTDPAGQAELIVEGATPTTVVDEIAVEYVRSDGIRLTGGMLDLTDDLKLSIDQSGGLELGTGSPSADPRLFFEAVHPTRDFLAGAFANPIRSVFASVRGNRSSLLAAADADLTSTIELSATGYRGAELVVVAASDPNDLGLPSGFPTTAPRTWSFASPSVGQPVVRVGVIDDSTRSTLALRASSIDGVAIDLDPVTLSQSFAIDTRTNSRLDARVELAPGTPLGGKEGAELSCVATLNGGPMSLVIEPPTRYGVDAASQVSDVACAGVRGDRTAELLAGNLPEDSSIELADVTDTGGRYDLSFEDTPSFDTADDLQISVVDPRGLLPSGLLGSPTTVITLFGDGVPSSSAQWETGEETGVVIAADSIEERIDHLEVILASDEPMIVENELVAPSGLLSGAGTIDGRRSTLRLWDTGTLRLLAGSAHDSHRVEAHHRKRDGGVAVELDARGSHTFTSQLYLPDRGHFTPQFTANGGCSVRLPVGTAQAEFVPDRRIRLSNGVGFPGSNALECRVSSGNGPLGAAVTTTLAAGDLPIVTLVTPEPDRASIETAGGVTGSVELGLVARTGSSLAGQTIFGEPARVAAVELVGARAVSVDWSDSNAGFTLDLSTGGTPLQSFGAAVSSGSTVTFAPVSEHRLIVNDADVSSALVQLVDVESTGINVGPGDPDEPAALSATVETDTPHPLTVRVVSDADGRLSPGLDLTLDGTIADLPSTFTFNSDLGAGHRFNSSDSIGLVDLTGRVACPGGLPTDPTLAAICSLAVDLELRDLPNTINFGLLDLVRTGSSVVVRSDGQLGSVDAVLDTSRIAGFFETGIDRLRVLAEDVPLRLGVELLEDTPTVGGFTMSGTSTTEVGRLLVELEAATTGALFGLPYQRMVAQLAGVPTTWSVEVAPDQSNGEFSADVRAGAPTEGIERIELLVNDRLPDDPGAFLNDFASNTFGAVGRSNLVRNLDNGYWDSTNRAALVDLHDVGVPLPVRSVPFPDAPDRPGVGNRTIATQDHVVVGGFDDGEFRNLSFGLSGIHRVRLDLTDDDTVVNLQRAGGRTAGALYVGATDTAVASYRGLSATELEFRTRVDDVLGNADWSMVFNDGPAGPTIARATTATRSWQWPSKSVIGFDAADTGFAALPVGTRLVGASSGVRATLHAVDAASSTVTVDIAVGFFDDGERIETSAGVGATVALEASRGVEQHAYRVLDLGEVENADPATFTVLIDPTKGSLLVDGTDVSYQPDTARWTGRDAFLFRVCDADGQCSYSFYGVTIAEYFTRGRAVQLLRQPGEVTITVANKTDGSPDRATIASSSPVGQFEYAEGPLTPLDTDGGVDEMRIRGNIDATDVLFDFGSINDMLPGRIAIDSSGLVNLVGLIGSPTDRIVFALRGEDISIQTKLDGLLVDDEENDLADYPGAGDCDDFIDFGCWLLFRIGADIDGRGDVTKTAADGFFALYEDVDLERRPGRGLVPRLTIPFEGLRTVDATFEVELDLGCGLTCDVVFPLDIEVDLTALVTEFELGFWDYGMDVCLPLIGECIDTDDPDYLEGEPWRLAFPLPLAPGSPLSKISFPAAPSNVPPLPLASTELVRGGTVSVVLPEGTSDYQLLIYSAPVLLAEGPEVGGDTVVATLPESVGVGEHTLVLTAEIDGELVQFATSVTVVTAGGPNAPSTPSEPPGPDLGAELPRTGGGIALVQPAILVLLAGLVLLVATRRRRRILG